MKENEKDSTPQKDKSARRRGPRTDGDILKTASVEQVLRTFKEKGIDPSKITLALLESIKK